jgi:hypothetical protein
MTGGDVLPTTDKRDLKVRDVQDRQHAAGAVTQP